MAQTMLADAPFKKYQTRGANYTADANGVVVVTDGGDVLDMVLMGCVYAQSAEGAAYPSANTAITTVGAGTLTAAGLVGGTITRSGSTAAYTDTTATAALIIAAMANPRLGQSWEVQIRNTVAFAQTMAGGTGVTLSGNTIIPPNSVGRFLLTYSADGAITMLGLGSSEIDALPSRKFVTISAGNGTLSAGDMEGASDVTLASSGATAMTTRTAVQLIAGVPNWQIGGNYRLRVYNTNGGTLTLTGGTDVTITGTATIATNIWRDYMVTRTTATAVTMQNLGAGAAT